jgi:hypothetical protein
MDNDFTFYGTKSLDWKDPDNWIAAPPKSEDTVKIDMNKEDLCQTN